MENKEMQFPGELEKISESVSVEKREEVKNVLIHVFDGVAKMRKQLDTIVVEDHNDKVNMKLANTIRLAVRNVRLEAERTFDAKRLEVQQAMMSFKTEDGLWLKAKQTMQLLTKEIEENARWKEDTERRFEAEQFEIQMQQRLNKVHKFRPDFTIHDVRQFNDENFNFFLTGIEKEYIDRIEAEKKAEAERIAKEKAEAERIEAQRIENERLKEAAEKREKEIEVERLKAKAEAERLEKIAEDQRKEQAKIKAELDAKLEAERKEKERLETEIKAKKEAEEKAEAERLKAEELAKKEAEKMAKAPLKKQLNAWIDTFEIQEFQQENEISKEIIEKFNSFKQWAKTKTKTENI